MYLDTRVAGCDNPQKDSEKPVSRIASEKWQWVEEKDRDENKPDRGPSWGQQKSDESRTHIRGGSNVGCADLEECEIETETQGRK